MNEAKVNMTKCLKVIAIILLTKNAANAQDFSCAVPNNVKNGKVAVALADDTLKSGLFNTTHVFFKMPNEGREIRQMNWIYCNGFVPDASKVISIKIQSITGLPQGITWYCSQESCLYQGGETGCVNMQGTPFKKGTYPIEIHLEGIGRMWGIEKSYACLIKTKITVE